MRNDFENAARWTKEHIAVPPLDEQRLFERSRRQSRLERLRLFAITAVAVVLIAGTGTGLAQKAYNGIRIWLSGSNAAIRVQSMAITQYPTSSEFRSIASRTVMPFVYPVGLPKAMKIRWIAVWPIDRPDTVSIIYSNGTGALKAFTIVANSALAQGAPPKPTTYGPVVRWALGDEQVIAGDRDREESAQVHAAMQKSTPATSVTENLTRAHKVMILGGFEKTALQADETTHGGIAVLIDSRHLLEVPKLAAHDQPLLASRMMELTQIPQLDGAPDYTHARYTSHKSIVLSAQAVRFVNATLSAHGGAARCACEILYEEHRHAHPTVTVLHNQ